jgi:NitT/TauT family transport system substrate-binding protein
MRHFVHHDDEMGVVGLFDPNWEEVMCLNQKSPGRLLSAFFTILAVWIALSGFIPADVKAAPTVKSTTIVIATWPGFALAFVAKEKGFFGPLSVDIKVVDDFSARRAALSSGQADFTIYTVDSLAFDVASGIRGVAILAIDQSTGADGIIARAPIQTAADLKGKKVAFTQGSPSHFLLAWYLKNASIPLSAISAVAVDDPTRAAQAFSGKQVDAAVTWEPNLSELKKESDVNTLYTSGDAPNLIIDILVASPAAMRNKPDVVQVVVNGWLKAVDYYRQDQKAAQAIMAKGLGLSVDDLAGMMPGLALYDRAANKQMFPTLKGAEKSSLMTLFDTAAQLWKEERLVEKQPGSKPYFDSRFVQKSN